MPCRSPARRLASTVTFAVVGVLAVAGCGSDSSTKTTPAKPTPAAAPAARRPFVSKMLPYQLTLPAGWSIDPPSQGSGSEEDEFVNANGTERLVVGHGYPKTGETVRDRVEANRAGETRRPGCVSSAKTDRLIEVGGRHGILWNYTCAPDDSGLIGARDTYSLSAQTIYRRSGHRRVGYRFTVVVPLADKTQAKPLLDRLLGDLAFLNKSAATGD